MHSTILIIFFFFFFLLTSTSLIVSAENVSFEFSSFTLRNITLVGDSYLRNGLVGLTRATDVPTTSSGALLYDHPIPLFDPPTNTTSSFSTTFSFSITNLNPSSFGDGIAFFLSPSNTTASATVSPAGRLGLPTSTRFLAVEFDTRDDSAFHDPNQNHVGFNFNSLNSIATVDPITHGIDLKSGNTITSWIDYSTEKETLTVFLSYSSSSKPSSPVLTVRNVDLSKLLKEERVYVGFSGSTSGSTEVHLIERWSFKSFGFVPKRQNLNPHNVSDNTVGVTGNGATVNFPPATTSSSNDGIGDDDGDDDDDDDDGDRKNKNKRRRIGIAVAVAGPAFFFVLFSILVFFAVRKWKGIKRGGNNNNSKSNSVTSFKAESFVTCPRQFDYKDLKTATREFHPSRIIGHGSFGTVYKAFFVSSGTIAAVKRSRHSHEGKTEFLAELSIIAGLRHKNLVQLQGWCVEKGELLLVYDFMPNGSLDKMLYKEPERGRLLNWSHRVNIAVGLASVLVYLHQECEQRVIHRDIKTGNILLDGNFNPRLGDFGLAKLMDHDKSPVSTLTAGTMGYLAPEYLQYGKATDKTDVFSYGVVILEVACGKRPIEREGQKMMNLVDWVWGLHSEGKVIDAADKRLNGEFVEEEMRKLLLLGLCCANPDSAERPSMRKVLQILNNEAAPISVPKVKPSLTFSSDLPCTIDDIVSDTEEFNTSQSMCEIKIDSSSSC
ncbi:hypothetical protein HN51_023644 [Arachis hypogaea]|uniref:non-specific serine/threonine protein kinase n=1 Tax=Arachis hypogaea TaxID=3818 RepID=A0A445C333_ARAHY|nr:probable L-type lectin-domain containing receptor kinase S.7 [Arachis hypogaea]QHO26545.1 putative L-type lectin-domain containing receptor kinase S [Arachis hypogaea]RYR45311.1 hypothetical protein Ahy_A07g031147 [Arachis hypogaea]